MLSSCRVKKGPGRRPLSAKREKFMELRERGWSIGADTSEVGVSRSSGNNWARGYKTYRRGQETGVVPPLDRLLVRRISARFLSQHERIEIADLRSVGVGVRQIAVQLGRAPSTISRELRRNTVTGRGYRPFDAHRWATARRVRHHERRVHTNVVLREIWSNFWGSGGVPSRSAVTCGCVSRASEGCGCVTKVSTRRFTSQVPSF
jgi:IS30 family transposase